MTSSVNFSKFADFNHKFYKSKDLNIAGGFADCSICNFKVWLGENEFWYFVDFSWRILDITCQEIQIKNLLE